MGFLNIIGLILPIILFSLGTLHVYWALGGNWGASGAIPTKDGIALFNPSSLATIFVSLALFAAAFIVLGRIGILIKLIQLPFIFYWGTWGIAPVFLLRAMVEFKYIGFFKIYKDSIFSYWDTRLFSPLCFFISLCAFLINVLKY